MNLTRVTEVAFHVKDIDGARKFFADVLELPLVQERLDGVQLAAGKVFLDLVDSRYLPSDTPADVLSAIYLESPDLPPGGEEQFEIQELDVGVSAPGIVDTPHLLPSPWVRNIDHIVISSNDSGATAAAFEREIGLEIKRKMIRPGTNAQLAFAKLGEVILEFAGPPEPKPRPVRAKYWGIVFNVRRLDALVTRIRENGYECSDPQPAVQPGARIATVKGYTGGVPTAIIEYGEAG